MATIVKDLGAVTAYAYAKEKGYTGTEDEFAELMASYADVAEQAAESAAQAGASAEAAEQAKAEAVLSASAAASSASTASTKASEAAQSASSASGSANTATTKANEASTSATNAASSASAAATSATNAGASATAAASSATAASNAKTAAETAQGKAEDAQTAAEDAAEQAGIYAAGYLKAFPVDTASGSIASFPDGADSIPVKNLTVAIEPVQSGSGDPSPSNIRPISGWTGCEVTRTGKNLFNYTLFNDGTIFSANNDGSITVKTQDTRGWARIPKFYLKAGTYTFSRSNTSGVVQCWSETNSTWVVYFAEGEAAKSFTLSAPAVIQFRIGQQASSYPFNVNIQLELGSTATAYEPYQGDTYDITFPSEAGTVYGGTLDVTSGVLTVNWALVDMGTLNWSKATYADVTMMSCPIASIVRESGQPIPAISSIYEASDDIWSSGTVRDKIFSINYAGTHIYVYDSAYTDATAFKAAMSGAQLAYKIPNSVEYTLTPTQIDTLLGTNNIWSDAGNVDVEYRADTKLYIQKINTPSDNDMVADSPIANGKYFIIGNTLYKATTTIAAGDTITPGTNCTETNLAEALNTINI